MSPPLVLHLGTNCKVTGSSFDLTGATLNNLSTATTASQPVVKSQFDAGVSGLQTQIDSIHRDDTTLQTEIDGLTASITAFATTFNSENLGVVNVSSLSYSNLQLASTLGDVDYYAPKEIVLVQTSMICPAADTQSSKFQGWVMTGAGIPANTTIVSYRYDYTNPSSTGRAIFATLSQNISQPSGVYAIQAPAIALQSNLDFKTLKGLNIHDAASAQDVPAYHQIGDAVAVETTRATTAESGLSSSISTINSTLTGYATSITTSELICPTLTLGSGGNNTIITNPANNNLRIQSLNNNIGLYCPNGLVAVDKLGFNKNTSRNIDVVSTFNMNSNSIISVRDGANAQDVPAFHQIADAVNTEKTRAQAAESTLTSSISSETTRAQAAESTLTTSISTESTRAQAAESTLTSSISTESTRAQTAETALSTSLASEVSTRTSAVTDLQAQITILSQKIDCILINLYDTTTPDLPNFPVG